MTSDLDVYAIYQKKSTITEIYVENKKACVDGEVQTYVKVKNNPGILGMIIQVDYDSKHLELIKAENGNAVKNNLTLTKGKKMVSGCKFVWDGVQLSDGGKKDGNILSLKFKIKKSVEGASSRRWASTSHRSSQQMDISILVVKKERSEKCEKTNCICFNICIMYKWINKISYDAGKGKSKKNYA